MFELGVRNGSIDVSIPLCQRGMKIVSSENDLQRSSSPRQSDESGHWVTAGNCACGNFKLSQYAPFFASESHVAREDEFATSASGTTTNLRNRDYRSSRKTYKNVGPCGQSSWPERHLGRFLFVGEYVPVG